jgi:uncharacterized membrane protein
VAATVLLEAVTLDSVHIGYRWLRREGTNVGGAYAEAVVTSSRCQTGRGAVGGSDARLGGGGWMRRWMRKIIGERPRATIFDSREGQ